jgi:hypothetical protein
MAFPSTARDGQTHNEFGKKYVYSEISGTWAPAVPLASLSEIRLVEQVSQTATASYATAAELPLSDNTSGKMAFVQETNRLYIWSGTGWYNIATITSAAASISGANSSYNLATDGTPTVITLNQSGLTSPTWSYSITSGSIGKTAVITQADNVFTITPSTQARNIGSFGVTFKATDGSNTIATSSQFTMSNTAPVIDTGPSATYALASDGTPTVITLAATDSDGHAITWSYEVVSGSLGGTTVTNVGPIFTITPSTDENDDGTFQLRFVASDGVASDTDVAEFTLALGPDWANNTTLLHTIDNPGAMAASEPGDRFGYSVAMNDTYMVIGAITDTISGDGSTNQIGRAYVYSTTTGTLLHTLERPSDIVNSNTQYGTSVSISGNYAIIGTPFADHADGSGNAGRAHIFDVSTGSLKATINNPKTSGSKVDNQFGYSVAISGNYAIVGTALTGGVAYIFKTTTGDWTDTALLHTIANPDVYVSAGDRFGYAVAMHGDYAIVGAARESSADFLGTGRAYVFNTTTGALIYTLSDSSPQAAYDQFGYSVAISDRYAVVGAPYADGTNADAGYISVFDLTTGNLVCKVLDPNPLGADLRDQFGWSVGISGKYVVASANKEQDPTIVRSGKTYIVNIATGTVIKTLVNPNAYGSAQDDEFGYSVNMFGNYIIVGVPFEDDAISPVNSGKVYVYYAS